MKKCLCGFLRTAVIGCLTLSAGYLMGEEPVFRKTIDIGSRLELFVDRFLVEKMSNVDFRLHHPQKLPLPKSPLVGYYSTVIKDGDLYRGYYRSIDPGYKGRKNYSGHPGEITCYAESRDGHEWTFPQLGLYKINGATKNNVILAGQPPFSHNFSPFLDTRPSVSTDERFKALAGHPGYNRKVKADGLHAFASSDGIHWRRTSKTPVIPFNASWHHAFDSQNVSFWSEAEQQYVAYIRTWKSRHGRLRTISRTTSSDFVQWSKPVPMEPNLPGEHLYTSNTHPYFRAPHLYIALPTRFHPGRGDSTDILFMVSRAGSTSYERLFAEALIRPGLDPARWGNRSNYAALNVVPTGDAEMSIYHAKSGHRYILRTDGFISVRAGIEKGELLTKPLTFTGGKLVLNLSTSAAGSVRVEIQNPDGSPIPGFRLQDCSAIIGDKIEQTVKWKGNPDLRAWARKPVRVRFVMTECDIYSFRFKPDEAALPNKPDAGDGK